MYITSYTDQLHYMLMDCTKMAQHKNIGHLNAITPGTSRTYQYRINQAGSYWIHSHVQLGLSSWQNLFWCYVAVILLIIITVSVMYRKLCVPLKSSSLLQK
ncbi:hypothetical protein BDC45DRAFT_508577 [Circinella umbellata]|nr:hypothetical protein BDC45DRAFT_508577 [Circinella umbellata]